MKMNIKSSDFSEAEIFDKDKGSSQQLTCRQWNDKRPPTINVSPRIKQNIHSTDGHDTFIIKFSLFSV